jgi:hypothetical protein
MFNLVNHNQTLANVRLQWSLPERSNHHPELLQKTVSYFETEPNAKLAMELVALRDIQPDEEIILDYGDEWEEAWQEHVRAWRPIAGADRYMTAEQMNRQVDRLKMKMELLRDPYPENVILKFDMSFEDPRGWKSVLESGASLDVFQQDRKGDFVYCEIMRHRKVDGRIHYSALIFPNEDDPSQRKMIKEAPREAFRFEELPYRSDMFLANAFRHDIRIPDDMFPEAWNNLEP